MARVKNILGNRYGRLVVVGFDSIRREKSGHTYAYWKCRCDCGNVIIANGSTLGKGKNSCGCLKKDVNHQRFYKGGPSKLYSVWRMMHKRCEDSDYVHFQNYGARGISVCSEWSGVEGYNTFRLWAESNGYSDGLTIDRIDNNKGYSPDNCRFVSMKTQSNNKRNNVLITIKGVTKTLTEWSEEYCVPTSRVRARFMKMGWTIEDALMIPRYGKRGDDERVKPNTASA